MARKFTVTLSDGTKLENLELNGNNFISDTKITADDFSGKLKHVVISCDEENYFDPYGLVGEHDNMELVQCVEGDANIEQFAGKYLFILRQPTYEERQFAELQARIEFLEMEVLQ